MCCSQNVKIWDERTWKNILIKLRIPRISKLLLPPQLNVNVFSNRSLYRSSAIQGISPCFASSPFTILMLLDDPHLTLTRLMFRWFLTSFRSLFCGVFFKLRVDGAIVVVVVVVVVVMGIALSGQQINCWNGKSFWSILKLPKLFKFTFRPQAWLLILSPSAADGLPPGLLLMIVQNDSQWCKRMHIDWPALLGSVHGEFSSKIVKFYALSTIFANIFVFGWSMTHKPRLWQKKLVYTLTL